MLDDVVSITDLVKRLNDRDPTLEHLDLTGYQYTDSELTELVDCLLAHPDAVTDVFLGGNRLTDETGAKLARYLAASSTVESLALRNNLFGSATYLALAAALRVNTSLRRLYLSGNQAVDRTRIKAAFVEALRLNPDRPFGSEWLLYSYLASSDIDFKRLKDAADELGHPSLQMLLVSLC